MNNVGLAQFGQMVIWPSSLTGSPRYVRKKTQDVMTYVRYYGRLDIFITFTCIPKRKGIISPLFPKKYKEYTFVGSNEKYSFSLRFKTGIKF